MMILKTFIAALSLFPMAMQSNQTAGDAAPIISKPLTAAQQEKIYCVASIALVAAEQDRGIASALKYHDMRGEGKKWIGFAGEELMRETGEPREIIALYFKEAAEHLQRTSIDNANAQAYLDGQMDKCTKLMRTDLARDAEIQAQIEAQNEAAGDALAHEEEVNP
ncbi:hypothetical protein LPB140_04450 [Sphingorhabdus lutea]|uniref:Uncharacterized protein n=1 Tax=Sphingorhabdus lutea TaxID=1913578 RepID=A0A1L3JAL5_9SPHN|nr:hypothetical protein [Sphingorhabdus lutea]APG62180.1 hypothetical protein LPB140_04450 [Sphingorhabdus lutea]